MNVGRWTFNSNLGKTFNFQRSTFNIQGQPCAATRNVSYALAPQSPVGMLHHMKQVYSALNEMDAHFLKGLLGDAGIEATVQGEALEQVWGNLPLSSASVPTVWVRDGDVARATPIVEEYNRRHIENQERGAASRSSWNCPRCGEKVEDQFTQCWKCGTTRPEAASTLKPG